MSRFNINYSIITKAFLFLISLVVIVGSIAHPSYPLGESAEYMLTTTAIVNHFSFNITQEDILKAQASFPEHAASFSNTPNLIVVSNNPKVYCSYYFGTYSASVIPAKWFLKYLGFDQSYAFALTNALLLILCLLVVYFKLKCTPKTKLIAILLLGLNPILFYIAWPSAEVFIYSMVVISSVFFANKKPRLAGLFVSIAGTLNLTIMFFGIIIILDYFFSLVGDNRNKKTNIFIDTFNICIKNIKNILILALCFIPCLIPTIYNLITLRKMVPMQSGATKVDLFDRFWAYLFDLNLGFLPYFLFLMIIFFVLIVVAIFKRRFRNLLLPIAFFGTILCYSIMIHINSGMTGIARYNAWLSPLMIFFVITQTDFIINHINIKRIIWVGCCVSVVYTSIVCYHYGGLKADMGPMYGGGNAQSMTPIARLVLDHFPSLYNPFHYTFVSRVWHLDGGYFYSLPVYYESKNDLVKKILVTSQTATDVYTNVYGDKAAMESLTQQINKIKSGKGFHYININSGKLYYGKQYTVGDIINFTDKYNTSNEYHITGFETNESDGTWTGSSAEVLLPLAVNIQKDSKLEAQFGELNSIKDVEIYVNNNLIGTVGRNSSVTIYDFTIPEQYLKGEQLDIVFKVDGAATPASLGMGSDSRILGIKISTLLIKNTAN